MSPNRQKSKIVGNRPDRRAERTRRHLDEAFFELLQRRSYDSIRVGDIARKADVGRATFYAHYQTKDELLRSQLNRVAGSLIRSRPEEPWLLDATALFRHVRDVRPLFLALTSVTSGTRVSRMLQDCIETRVLEILEQKRRAGAQLTPGVPSAVAARFVSASLLAVLIWWTENEVEQAPDEMQEIFRTLIAHGLRLHDRRRV